MLENAHPPTIDVDTDVPVQLCLLAELDPTGCREFRLGAGDWPVHGFVVRAGSEVRAYVNRCPHQLLRMNVMPDDLLTADRRYIVCEMHDALFEKDSGLCIAGPCLGRQLWTLPIRIEGGRVLLAHGTDIRTLIARFT